MKAFAILFLASLLQAQSLDPQLNKILNLTQHFQRRSTKAFTIYTENPSFDFKLINMLSESALSKACKTLKQKTYSKRIHIFVFNSPESIEKVVGVKINGGAIPPSNILLSIYTNDNQTFSGPHEFMHIISHCFWGEAPSTWLNEGLAVFSDNAWWGYDLHAIAKTIKNIEHFDILKFTENGIIESDPNHYYPLAGSFIKYIVDKLGLEYLKLIWKNDPSTSNASNLDKLKLEWSEFLNTVQPIKEKYPS